MLLGVGGLAGAGSLQRAIDRGATGRILLVVDDPGSVADAAVAAGAELVSPVDEEHGWELGRIVDPFGHEWEIGHPLGRWPPPAPDGPSL